MNPIDLICLSHLRWGFVFQRPQHLMSRFAKNRRVFFVEEPLYTDGNEASLQVADCPRTGVTVVTPHLPHGARDPHATMRDMLRRFLRQRRIQRYVAWFYTPMALEFADDLKPEVTIYDCMDELSLFRGAPPRLCENEEALLRRSNLVFTGGVSLFEAKCNRHPKVYPFPSGVDTAHFAKARQPQPEPADQSALPRPRIGYAGVIDERIDIGLIDQISRARPDWQIVMLGPVVKIDPASLPHRENLHWLGMKDYQELPAYFSGWKCALLPFAMNEATRFISPTKTPEYLAAGLPAVSTPIRDVVRPYGDLGLARIAGTPADFIDAIEQSMAHGMSMKWRERADQFLSTLSWDATWNSMSGLIEETLAPAPVRKPAVMSAGRSFGLPLPEGDIAGV